MKKLKEMSLINVCVVASLFVFGCTNHITENDGVDISMDPEQVAIQYVQNMNVWDNISKNRNATATVEYPGYLDNMNFVDEKGDGIIFSELPEERKSVFLKAWQDYESDRIAEILRNDERLLQEFVLENQAVLETLKFAERNVLVDRSSSLFMTQYLKRRAALIGKKIKEEAPYRSSSSSAKVGPEVTADCLVKTSVEKLKSVYRTGLVLICTDSSSSTSSLYLGHCAMTNARRWESKFELNGLESISISSWPKNNKVSRWEGQIDGVQEEPIGYWAGNSGGSARNVKVLEMQLPVVEVHWAWIFPYFKTENHNPSPEHVEKAVSFAESKKGKPYAPGFALGVTDILVFPLGSKWWVDSYYCSHLVWRAWVHADLRYDFSKAYTLIPPYLFESARNKNEILTYSNY